MSPLALAEVQNKREYESKEHKALDVLKRELELGMQNIKSGEVYTIEEVWGELDEI